MTSEISLPSPHPPRPYDTHSHMDDRSNGYRHNPQTLSESTVRPMYLSVSDNPCNHPGGSTNTLRFGGDPTGGYESGVSGSYYSYYRGHTIQ